MKHKFSINHLTLAFANVLLCAVFTSCQVGIEEKPINKELPQWLTEITFNDGVKDTLIIKSECEPHLTVIDGKSIVRACGYSVFATDVRLLKIIR